MWEYNFMSEEQITIAKMQKDIEYLKSGFDDIKKTLNEFIECADKKYAPREAWEVIVWVARIFGGLVVTALFYLIVVHGKI